MEFFITRAEKTSFINLLVPAKPTASKPAPPNTYVPFKYVVSPDAKSVEFWSLKVEVLEPPINAGKLKGYINKDDDHSLRDGVTLRDSAENIMAFIHSKPDEEVFEKFGVLKKVD